MSRHTKLDFVAGYAAFPGGRLTVVYVWLGTNMDVKFDYRATRATKARFARRIDGLIRLGLMFMAVALVLGGLALVLGAQAVGWLVFGVSVLPAMIVEWYDGELKDLSPSKNPVHIDDVLDSKLLGQLPENPTPKDIATAVGAVNDGLFFGARFGVTSNLLVQVAESEEVTTEAIFRDALQVMKEQNLSKITAGALVWSILKQFINHEVLLAHLHISLDDILKGITWQEHLKTLIKRGTTPKRTGGIARDWSFGYTPLLSRFGQNISEQISRGGTLNVEIASHRKAIEKLEATFSTNGSQNAVLVGSAGVGKTSIVEGFAADLLDASSNIPDSLKFRQVFMLDSSALLSAASGRGEIESLLNRVLGEAYAAKNIIICLDDAQLFFEDGVGSVDVSNVLLPILEAGRLRIILTMDEQRYLQISQRKPAVANSLNRVSLAPATRDETLAVLQDQLILNEFKHNVTYTYQSLAEAYRLSERYVHDLVMPGRAVKLLESAAGYAESGLVTINSVQQAIEQTMNVKVSVASETEDREKLLNLEALIHQRMINQTRAVGVVSDALRRARAGVRNQNRPIGTFLFLGPTGVGKTELAKALADVYFGGEDRIIRLDLNEYVTNEDVARLIADGAKDPTSLTAQAMKQPFSVVLLDEIEKAHPNVLTTLLQLLDEGILRDEKNREVSFRDAIVIATSNAGADRIREYISRGYKMEQFEQQFNDELISSGQFKPEFLNRFDEIVLFTPLSKADLIKVVDLILAGVNETLEQQRVSINVSDDAKRYLVEKGYDPRLGARPLRRVVQRAVENTVAKRMLAGESTPGSIMEITLEQIQGILGVQQAAKATIEESNRS